jgi:Concanavalin A-like lectin/glucanases superfamily
MPIPNKTRLFFLSALSIFLFSCQKDVEDLVNESLRPPIVEAGVSQTVQLPVNSLTLAGTATTTNGRITAYLWSMVSGPNVPVIHSPGSSTTLISNLAAGSYLFQLMATDSAGLTGVDTTRVVLSPPDIISGLVAFYPFSGNAGDSSGNNNHGAVNGAVLSSDRFGNANKAYYFPSTNCATYISATINTSTITSGLSIAFWVNKSGDGCIAGRLMSFWPGSIAPGTLDWAWANNNVNNLIHVTSSNQYSQLNGFTSTSNGTWTHLVYTNDGSNGRIYQDGILKSTFVVSGNPVLSGNASFGRLGLPQNDAFNGKMDEIRIYNRALTPAQISYLLAN